MANQHSERMTPGSLHLSTRIWISLLGLMLVFQLMSGCARFKKFAENQADRAAYDIIRTKQMQALGEAENFTIKPIDDEATRQMMTEAGRLPWDHDEVTTPSYLLSLSDSLAIAVANSREYQSQKEQLFNQALSLTESRRDFKTIYNASAYYSGSRTESGHGTPAGVTVDRFDNRGFSAGLRRLFAYGGSISLDFTHSYVRNLTNGALSGSSNDLAISLAQPLLRGAGSLVAHEGLRQAERNLIYSVRNFRRYQQNFVIDAAQRYYALLRAKDQLDNADQNYERAKREYEKAKRMAEGGRQSNLQVGQQNQSLLQSEVNWNNSQTNYLNQLDSYKQFLGLDLDLDIGPDPAELEAISERGLIRPEMQLNDAIQIALENRLDFINTQDETEDARRGVEIAFRNFLPDLDLSYRYSVGEDDDKDRIKLQFEDNSQSWGLDLGLPMDWTPRRNYYRRALLSLTQAERQEELERENLILEVRRSWRELERLRRDYEIQLERETLAELQHFRATILLEQGGRKGVQQRDLVEANNQLLNAQNAVTSALVDYTIQRLRFWNSIERLEIDEKGMWNENN